MTVPLQVLSFGSARVYQVLSREFARIDANKLKHSRKFVSVRGEKRINFVRHRHPQAGL